MDKQIKAKKPWYKKVWVWAIIIVALIGVGGAGVSNSENNTATTNETPNSESKTIETKPAESPKAESKKWDMEAAYAKIDNGMTKAQVEEATGKKSESCSESQNEYTGKLELCNYGNAFIDKGVITVTYSNDTVSGKNKSTY